jgi:hypothetical protein
MSVLTVIIRTAVLEIGVSDKSRRFEWYDENRRNPETPIPSLMTGNGRRFRKAIYAVTAMVTAWITGPQQDRSRSTDVLKASLRMSAP